MNKEQLEAKALKKYPVQMDSITTTDGHKIEYDYNEELREAFIAGYSLKEGAGTWVRASERLPEKAGQELIVRVTGGEFQDKKIICLGWFHSEGKQIDATRGKVTLSYSGHALSKIEWLDESQSSPTKVQSDANI